MVRGELFVREKFMETIIKQTKPHGSVLKKNKNVYKRKIAENKNRKADFDKRSEEPILTNFLQKDGEPLLGPPEADVEMDQIAKSC